MSEKVCEKCGISLGISCPEVDNIKECPKCGGTAFKYVLNLSDSIQAHEKINMKVKVADKKKPVKEYIGGEEFSKELGKFVLKTRVIDREKDDYYEEVKDSDTGAVIHNCHEPLTEHFGHGSDKRNHMQQIIAKIRESARQEFIEIIQSSPKYNTDEEKDNALKKMLDHWDEHEKFENRKASVMPLSEMEEKLEKISHANTENILLVAVKDDAICADYIKGSGSKGKIDLSLYDEPNEAGITAIDFMKKWNCKGAKIYNFHNHPNRIVAFPSIADLLIFVPKFSENDEDRFIPLGMERFSVEGKELLEKVNSDFKFADWGIVTEYDSFLMNKNDEEKIWDESSSIEIGL